jgi:hypothetical protein
MGTEYRNPGGGYGWVKPPSDPRPVREISDLGCAGAFVLAVALLAWALGGIYLALTVAALGIGFILLVAILNSRRASWTAQAMSQASWSRVHEVATQGYSSVPYNISAFLLQREDGTYWAFTYDEVRHVGAAGPMKGLRTLDEARNAADRLAHGKHPIDSCYHPLARCQDWQTRKEIH